MTKVTLLYTFAKLAQDGVMEVAERLNTQYHSLLNTLVEANEISDDEFVGAINLMVACDEGGVKTFSSRTFLDEQVMTSWLKGDLLPRPLQRLPIMQICVTEALSYLERQPPEHVMRSVMLPIFLESVDAESSKAPLKSVPAWETPLEILPEWKNLSVRARNAVKNADIRSLGELAAYHELKMLRLQNFGKKSLKEIKAFLLIYGIVQPPREDDIPPELWKYLKQISLRLRFIQRLPDPSDIHMQWPFYEVPKEVFEVLYQNGLKTFGRLATVTSQELENMFQSNGSIILSIKKMLHIFELEIGMEKPEDR